MVSKKNKIILLLPAKTASNSVVKAFTDAGVQWSKPVKEVSYPVYHLLLSEISYIFDINKENLNEYTIIQITRDPYDRMISAWQHQMEITGIRLPLRQFLKKLQSLKSLLPSESDLFYSLFYDKAEHKVNSFKRGNWGGLRFYFEQTWHNDLHLNVHYIKLDDIANNLPDLSKLTGLRIDNFPHIKVNKSVRLKDFNYYSSDEERDIVKTLYINDFEKLGYGF